MGKLQNRRHEIFAVELASGAPLLTAYLAAGYRETYSARFNASRLKNTPSIRMRIDELQFEFGRTTFVRLEWIQHQLVRVVEGKDATCVRVDADGNDVLVERDRLGALGMLARTIGGFVAKVEAKVETDNAGEVSALFRSLCPADQRVLIDAIQHLADARREQEVALPAAPSVTSDNRYSPRQSPPVERSAPTPPPEPLRPGRVRFLQLAQLRAGATRPLNPEFTVLRSDLQRALVNSVSPVRREPDLSTWPASPAEIREALERLAPVEINELLNLMAAKSDTHQAFDSAL